MQDPLTALTTAIDASSKLASNPTFMTAIDKWSGYKLSQWKAEGDVIQKQIKDGYEDAKERGLGLQYATAFRSSANLLNTATKATDHIDATIEREIGFDEDVFWNLLEHSKTISDDEVQELIARIIAGEYNQKGSYSMGTIQTLKYLGKAELEALARVGSMVIQVEQIPDKAFRLGDGFAELMKAVGTSYMEFQALQNLGLFYPNAITQSFTTGDYKAVVIRYQDKGIAFLRGENAPEKVNLPSFYGLSEIGKQIMKHIDVPYNESYLQWLFDNYDISGYEKKSVTDLGAATKKE
jgi:hypothetical protein